MHNVSEHLELRAALQTINDALRHYHSSDPTNVINDALRSSDQAHDPGPSLRLQVHQGRTQLRYVGERSAAKVPSGDDQGTAPPPPDKLTLACIEASMILHPIALAALPIEHRSFQTESILDAFFYPPCIESACPPHVDPGLVTVICDNKPGLEIQHEDGQWQPVAATGAVVVLAGRQLMGAESACVHRVMPVASARTSIAFELRLDATCAHAATEREQAKAEQARSTVLEDKYLRARSSLLGAAAAQPRAHDGLPCKIV